MLYINFIILDIVRINRFVYKNRRTKENLCISIKITANNSRITKASKPEKYGGYNEKKP